MTDNDMTDDEMKEERSSDPSSLRCEEAVRKLAFYLDGELSADERAEIEHHLETCRSCYSRAEFEKRLKKQLQALRDRSADPGLEERIRGIIRNFPAA